MSPERIIDRLPWDKIDDLYLLTFLGLLAIGSYIVGDVETGKMLASATSGAIAMYVKGK